MGETLRDVHNDCILTRYYNIWKYVKNIRRLLPYGRDMLDFLVLRRDDVNWWKVGVGGKLKSNPII